MIPEGNPNDKYSMSLCRGNRSHTKKKCGLVVCMGTIPSEKRNKNNTTTTTTTTTNNNNNNNNTNNNNNKYQEEEEEDKQKRCPGEEERPGRAAAQARFALCYTILCDSI